MGNEQVKRVPEEVRLERSINALARKIARKANTQHKKETGHQLDPQTEYVVIAEASDFNIPEAGNHDSLRVYGDGSFGSDSGFPASFEGVLQDYAFVTSPEYQAIERDFWIESTFKGFGNEVGMSEAHKDWDKRFNETTEAFIAANKNPLMRGLLKDMKKLFYQPTYQIRSDA